MEFVSFSHCMGYDNVSFSLSVLRWFLICMKVLCRQVLSFFLNQNIYLDGLSLDIKMTTISIVFVN